MMRAHWLLLKAHRRELLPYCMVTWFLIFLLAFFGLETAWFRAYTLTGSIAMAILALLALGFGSLLSILNLRFCYGLPLTERAIAWMPMALIPLFWCVGLAGLAFAQAVVYFIGYGTVPWAEFWGSAALLLPLVLFGTLMILRGLRCASPMFFGFVFFTIAAGSLPAYKQYKLELRPLEAAAISFMEECIRSYPLWWPVLIPLAILYFLEAPYHVSAVGRRMGFLNASGLLSQEDPQLPVRHHPITLTVDFVYNGLVSMWVIPLILVLLATTKSALSMYPLMALAMIAAILGGFFKPTKKLLRSVEASGFQGTVRWGVSILAMSGLFTPIANAMGLKRGETVRCRKCNRYRFVWALRCPHCQVRAADIVHINTPLLARLSYWRQHSTSDFYHFALPLVLVFHAAILSTILKAEYSEAVTYERVQIDLGIAPSPDDRMQAANEFRETATRLLARSEWPAQEETSGLSAPERHSFAAAYEGDRLIVDCYSLRWAQATGLAEALARQVLSELDVEWPVEAGGARDAPLWTPSVWGWRDPFDGQLRWVDSKE